MKMLNDLKNNIMVLLVSLKVKFSKKIINGENACFCILQHEYNPQHSSCKFTLMHAATASKRFILNSMVSCHLLVRKIQNLDQIFDHHETHYENKHTLIRSFTFQSCISNRFRRSILNVLNHNATCSTMKIFLYDDVKWSS